MHAGDEDIIGQYRAIIEGSAEGILIADIETKRFVYANPAICKLLGYSKDELLNLSVMDIHRQTDLPEVVSIFEKYSSGDGALAQNIPCLRKDGSVFFASINISKINYHGSPSAVGFFSDTTERRQAELELEAARRDWETIFQGIPHPTAILDANNSIIMGNSKLELLLENRVSEYRGIKCWELFHGPDTSEPPKECPFVDMSISNRSSFSEMEIEAFNGFYIVSCTPLLDSNGKLEKVLHIATDITDRRKAEEALKQSELKYRSIVENVNDALFIHHFDGTIIDVNENACQSLGYTREELVGSNLSRIDCKSDARLYQKRTEELLNTGNLVFEGKHIRKDGTEIDVHVSAKIVSNKGNGIIQGFARDITTIKKMEEALLLSQKLESLGILAGGIAHDFNNLLSGIYGYVDMARFAAQNPEVVSYMDATLNTLDRARGLTQQLLTFARGGTPLRKTGDIAPLIRETVHFALSGSKVSCVVDLSDDLWLCYFDKAQIGQVVDNIIINAEQAMPLGGTITVSGLNVEMRDTQHSTLDPGRYVKISFKDEGIGIPEHIQSRIFDPFFTTKQKGSGLGLATSYSIIKRHGGEIEVASRTGVGTTFTIFLPASTAETDGDQEDVTAFKHGGEGKILVMDDEEVVRKTVQTMLSHQGYSVECVSDGQRAVDAVSDAMKRGSAFNAIFLDLTVQGGIGGLEAVAKIRDMDQNVPIFVSSGYAEDPVMANPRNYGFTDSLRKPFLMADLSKLLSKYMNRQ